MANFKWPIGGRINWLLLFFCAVDAGSLFIRFLHISLRFFSLYEGFITVSQLLAIPQRDASISDEREKLERGKFLIERSLV